MREFQELSKQRQMQILQAGLQVFSQHDYRHALSEDVAAHAGISKGLLFYYFHNKKGLYRVLLSYCNTLMMQELRDRHVLEETDFFEMLKQSIERKLDFMEQYPYVLEFLARSYRESDAAVKDVVYTVYEGTLEDTMLPILAQVDTDKFLDDVDVQMVWKLIYYFSEGYMRPYLEGKIGDLHQIAAEAMTYMDVLRRHFYKEEYR